MCGIGGILRRDGGEIPEEWLDRLDARIAHRGPDGAGRFRDEAVTAVNGEPRIVRIALVHRRLSIIDHAGGAQPMISQRGRDESEGRIAVVFNGCIYNHRALRAELQAAGRHFESDHSDTEVLIHGYREWGAELADHLEGMFAAAVWDHANASLMLLRDWFGEKPLYVHLDGEIIAFASDAEALARMCGDASIAPIEQRGWLGQYLQLGVNWRDATVYGGGLRSVPPTITQTHGELMPQRTRAALSTRDFEQLIDHAVQQRLEADVPLGCFLSGGVDSSLMAHFAKAHLGELHTFTVRMPDERYDESHHAEEVAQHLGTKHHTLDAAARPADDLVHLVRALGQPFGDSSILPTYWVSRAARQHVKVALSGDGGDELFLGYDRYQYARALVRHRRVLRWVPDSIGAAQHPKTRRHKLARLGAMSRDLPRVGILAMESIFTQRQIARLLPELQREGDHAVEVTADERRSRTQPMRWEPAVQRWRSDPMQDLRRADLVNYLPNDLLLKVDTASMAVALEVRAPFLDHDLVRAALAAPTWQLMEGGKRKGLLRAIARKHLPEGIADRPKMGFAIPIGEWFRSDFGGMKTLLLDHLQSAEPFGPFSLHRSEVQRYIDEHMNGTAEHGQRLFTLLTLSMWGRETKRQRRRDE